MKFNIFLFDLDGTLLHLGNIGVYVDIILEETFKKLKASNPPQRNEKYRLWSPEEDFFDVLEEWGINNPQNFWKVFDEIDFTMRKKLINQKQIFLYNDVFSTLRMIHKQKENKLAIVSNAAYYIVNYILDKFNITQFFHELFSLGYYENDQELAKPSPKGILTVLEKFKFDPKKSKAIFVGDSKFDIIAAKRANINACLIRRETRPHNKHYKEWDFQPDFVIEELNEIFFLK
ncbi:MAG: HAD family hydrolase [Candidatus Thorarchaeota archaeon]